MDTQTPSTRPLMSLALGVIQLLGIMIAFAAAGEVGAIDATVAKRGVAISIGLMMMVTANTDTASESATFEAGKRLALLNLFFGFCWVFATFLADALWGDRASQSMATAFVAVVVAGNAMLWPFLVSRAAEPAPDR